MKSHFGKMGKFGGVGGIKGTMAKEGGSIAFSYILTSLLLLSSYYYFMIKISKKNDKTAQGVAIPWIVCSSCVALLIFASSQVPSLLQPAVMGCGLTLTISCIICCSTSCFAGGF